MPPRGILPRTGGGAREQTLGLVGYLDNVIQSDQAIGDCHARYSLALGVPVVVVIALMVTHII